MTCILQDCKLRADKIRRQLLDWYDIHHRDFPWRISPCAQALGLRPNPYHVWLSEIMLQQTTTKTVHSYFIKFIHAWPTIKALAEADIEDIMKAWAGLGYYARARNLSACAKRIVKDYDEKFPKDEKILQSLPGIGSYTAAAISAIAFNNVSVAVDGNIKRIISRIYALKNTFEESKHEIFHYASSLLSAERPGDFTQALMDLGSLVCLPKTPRCSLCPIHKNCTAFLSGHPEKFPKNLPKYPKPYRYGSVFIIKRAVDGAILMKKRPQSGLLGGMTEFLTSDWKPKAYEHEKESLLAAPFPAAWYYCTEILHIFTHFRLYLKIYSAAIHDLDDGSMPLESFWSLNPYEEALPSVMKKAFAAATFPESKKN